MPALRARKRAPTPDPEPEPPAKRGRKAQKADANDDATQTQKPASKAKGKTASKKIKQEDDQDDEADQKPKSNGKARGKAKEEPAAEAQVSDAQYAKGSNLVIPVDERWSEPGFHVYVDNSDGIIYDAALNQTNSGNNNNKFYRIQVRLFLSQIPRDSSDTD